MTPRCRRPRRLLTDLVRLLPDDTVTLVYEEGDGVLAVTSGVTRLSPERLQRGGLSATSPARRATPQHRGERVLETIDKVGRAASRDESRPVLTGILVRFEGDKLVMAATDSYRLAVGGTPLLRRRTRPRGDHPGSLRSRSSSGSRPAARTSSSVSTRPRDLAPATWLDDRRIDGQFPNYNSYSRNVRDRDHHAACAAARGRSPRGPHGTTKRPPLRLRFAEGELTISAQTQDVGEAVESLPVDFAGEELEIGFNPDFLRDGLEAVRAATPCSCSSTDCAPASRGPRRELSYLIMPIRLAG